MKPIDKWFLSFSLCLWATYYLLSALHAPLILMLVFVAALARITYLEFYKGVKTL